MQDSEQLHAHLVDQAAKFPSPSSGLWDQQESQGKQVKLSLPQNRFWSSSSNPWGLQDTAFPVMEISLPQHTFAGDVTYTPVEAFQPLPTVSTHPACHQLAFLPVCFCSSCSFHRGSIFGTAAFAVSASELIRASNRVHDFCKVAYP